MNREKLHKEMETMLKVFLSVVRVDQHQQQIEAYIEARDRFQAELGVPEVFIHDGYAMEACRRL